MQRDVQGLTSKTFDLLVIGGGIHGAWVAWDASLRGLDVALIDAADFANATSSNSLKIVHGGLRYLQSADVRRMRESIRERSILLRVANHLVQPLPFLLPLYGHGLRGPAAMRAALAIADLIGVDRNNGASPAHRLPSGKVISTQECRRSVPGVPSHGLTGGAVWYDAQAHSDSRVVLSVLHSAAERGATLANYVEATGLHVRQGKVVGISARDCLSGSELDIRSRVTVNAAGPWSASLWDDELRRPPAGDWLLSKAMNLAVPRLFDQSGVGLDTGAGVHGKGRLLFAVPWRDHSLIGTTHVPYTGHPSELQVTEEDIAEFLADFNSAYPDARLSPGDVRKVYAGLIPAIRFNGNQSVVLASRHRVDHAQHAGGPAGLITVTGVKFTTARLAAEEAVDGVFEELDYTGAPECTTDRTAIAGSDAKPASQRRGRSADSAHYELLLTFHEHLTQNYGSHTGKLLTLVQSNHSLAERVWPSSPVIKAEVVHAVQHEMAQNADDVIFRRTDLGVNGAPPAGVVRTCDELIARARHGLSDRRTGEPDLDSTAGRPFSPEERRVTVD